MTVPNATTAGQLAPSFLPAVGVLEITYACSHRCLFCSCPWEAEDGRFDRKPELTAEQWKALITRLGPMGVCSFAFTGGEASLKPGIEDIIEHAAACTARYVETRQGQLQAWDAPPRLTFLSNGTDMHDDLLAVLARHEVHLSLSLPGLKTYRDHTGNGSAQNVLEWFGKAKAAGVTTTVNIAVTRKNLPELYEAIAEALLAGADTLLMNRFMPGGRGLTYAGELTLSNAQILEMLDTAEEVLRTANRRGHVGTELPRCLVNPSRYEHLKVGTRCSAATGFFVVGPSGYVRVCNHSEVRLNHVDDLASLKDNPYWRRFTLKRYLPEACTGCPEMAGCDGGCREAAHIVGGEVDSLDPLLTEEEVARRKADMTTRRRSTAGS